MKRIAILVIAATNQPVYLHYIASYWTEYIRYTNKHVPHIDVFLMNEGRQPRAAYAHLGDHVIEDPRRDFDELLPRRFHGGGIPSVLHKTVHALDLLAGQYDVFFRTNLSSMVMTPAFDRYVQATDDICYSGAWVWTDALRNDLIARDRVGPKKSIRSMSDLDRYPGNTFVSGSGFFLNATEAAELVAQRAELQYGLPDDVSIGLMLDRHRVLRGFAQTMKPQDPIAETLERVERTEASHIRLQHFPVERAQALWRYLERSRPWE